MKLAQASLFTSVDVNPAAVPESPQTVLLGLGLLTALATRFRHAAATR